MVKAMSPYTKAATVFAFAGAAAAFVRPEASGGRARVEPLVPAALHGDIEIVSFGIASLSGDGGAPLATLHVRETFANRGDDVPWAIDFSTATAWLGGATPATPPMLVNSDAVTLPLLIVGRGERKVADLYFPVPAGTDEDSLKYFSLTYRIHTADARYEQHAMLERADYWPSREVRGAEPGWGRRWWSDPSYAWAEYRHRPGYATPRPPTKIEIVHVPRALYEVALPPADEAGDDDWPRTDECDDW
jgi:hypothetical protein